MIEIKRREKGKRAEYYRKEGFIPGVLYGPEIESTPIYINKKEFLKNFTHIHQRFDFIFDNKNFSGILQDVQRDPITLEPIHFDIYLPSISKKIETAISINFIGEDELIKRDLILNKNLNEIPVEGLMKDIPESIDIDVSKLDEDESIYVKDLKLKDIKILLSEDTPIATAIKVEKVEEVEEKEEVKAEETETQTQKEE
ncbi:MAG: 50S ribosomal protein L25 [Minisyncoccia bacterium]